MLAYYYFVNIEYHSAGRLNLPLVHYDAPQQTYENSYSAKLGE